MAAHRSTLYGENIMFTCKLFVLLKGITIFLLFRWFEKNEFPYVISEKKTYNQTSSNRDNSMWPWRITVAF